MLSLSQALSMGEGGISWAVAGIQSVVLLAGSDIEMNSRT
jgi:hypothetical protein